MSYWLLSRSFVAAGLVSIVLATTAGCSGTLEDAADRILPSREPQYKSSKRAPPLEIPPDLSSASVGDSYPVPGGDPAQSGTTYSDYASGGNSAVSVQNAILPQVDNVRIERSGDTRWLVINATPAEIWPRVREFWLQQGFLIQIDDPSVGILETDWAEQRSRFKGGLFSFMRLADALYSASTRDKFRTRLERGVEPGTTEVFISHRGAEEVLPENRTKPIGDNPEMPKVWQPRPAEPELEAEMLHRMMVSFGMDQERAREIVAQTPDRRDRARLVQNESGGRSLSLEDNFPRAWRRTGLALDRVGFTVEDRDRTRGLYFVRYVDPNNDISGEKKEGFFSKLKFWGDESRDTSKDEYLISLVGGREGENTTEVMVLNTDGEPENSDTANRILSLLHEQLK